MKPDMSRAKCTDYEPIKKQPTLIAKRYTATIANPVPIACFSFASTAFLLSMLNINVRGIHTENIIVGMAVFTGGLLQFSSGMWEFPRGNVLGATVFTSYGAFWMSFATILIPGFGIENAYSDSQELANAIGLYIIVWFIFGVMLISAVIRRHLAFTTLLIVVSVQLILLSAAQFMNKPSLTKTGGIVGIITALIAYYIAMSELLAAEDKPIFKLPQGVW